MTATAISLRDRLIELLEPVVRDLGLKLWELEFLSRSNGALLRIYIDVVDANEAVRDEGSNRRRSQRVRTFRHMMISHESTPRNRGFGAARRNSAVPSGTGLRRAEKLRSGSSS